MVAQESFNQVNKDDLIHELHTHQLELELQNQELRNTEQKLLIARNRFSDLYDLSPVGYLTLSPKCIITEANLTMADMLGIERNKLLGRSLSPYIHQQTQDIYYLYIKNILKNHRALTCEVQLQKEGYDQELRWARMDARPVLGDAAKVNCIHLSISDISARKIAERQLNKLHVELELRVESRTAELTAVNQQLKQTTLLAQQSARAKSEFLASMSHEIRTPMNGVLGIADLLETTELDEEQKNYIHVIKNSGNTLLAVINDILDYSKIESKNLELEQTPFNMNQLLEEMLATYKLRPEDNVSLILDCDPDIPDLLLGDTTRLNQVLNNLLSNAFKFTKKGEIKLTLNLASIKNNSAVIKFSISDTGIGIADEKLKTLFLAFTQADQSTSRQYGGTGLGLAISQKLITLMGGKIEVESKVGVGSNFCFSVAFNIAEQSLIEDEKPVSTMNYTSLKVLVAEDNTINQMVVMGMMKKIGAKATMVPNGAEAVALVCNEKKNYDLILMDCEMPIMDGYEATKNIRQWEAEYNIDSTPIYALTAHALKEHVNRCEAIGMDGHLTKPINMEKLRNTLQSIGNM